jgi:endonuclease/exonuclease/phosphatase (EEP) superfamily protein YafD
VVVALLVVVVVRIVAWDSSAPFAVLDAGTAFAYLPAWIVLVVAGIGRRPGLAVAALVVVVAQVVFLVPELTAAQPVPPWTRGAPVLRLFDANVDTHNGSMSGYARQIASLRPDVVTLEEANPSDITQLIRSGALARLPYRIQIARHDPWAFLVASRYPLADGNAVYSYGRRPLIVQTTVRLPSGPVALWVVHTIAPLPSSFAEWGSDLALVDHSVRLHGPDRLLVVGDFNATWGNRGFRSILDEGLADGAAARGQAFAMTWSQTAPVVPPLVRVDHVLTGTGVAVTAMATGDGPGSDHRDLSAVVAIRS